MKTKTIAPAESAKRLANLEYEFLLAINALDELAGTLLGEDAISPARRHLWGGQVSRLSAELTRVLAEIDEPITELVLAAGG